MSNILPQTNVAFAANAAGKLNRTEKGRELLNSDLGIADLVKYDPDDPDRIWIGVRRTSVSKSKHRMLRCTIDETVFRMMEDAIQMQDSPTLNSLAIRLISHFRDGRKDCRFMLEDDS